MAHAGKGYRYHRADANHKALCLLARQLGGFVVETHQGGASGCPDCFVFTREKGWAAVEIKSGAGKLSGAQIALRRCVPVLVWREERDVCVYFGVADE